MIHKYLELNSNKLILTKEQYKKVGNHTIKAILSITDDYQNIKEKEKEISFNIEKTDLKDKPSLSTFQTDYIGEKISLNNSCFNWALETDKLLYENNGKFENISNLEYIDVGEYEFYIYLERENYNKVELGIQKIKINKAKKLISLSFKDNNFSYEYLDKFNINDFNVDFDLFVKDIDLKDEIKDSLEILTYKKEDNEKNNVSQFNAIGEYILSISFKNKNYELNSNNFIFTVNKAKTILEIKDFEITYGDSFEIKYKLLDKQNKEISENYNIKLLDKVKKYTTSIDKTDIEIESFESEVYQKPQLIKQAKVNVNKKELILDLKKQNIIYGEKLEEFKYDSLIGLIDGEQL